MKTIKSIAISACAIIAAIILLVVVCAMPVHAE